MGEIINIHAQGFPVPYPLEIDCQWLYRICGYKNYINEYHWNKSRGAKLIMKLTRIMIIFLTVILSVTLLLIVDFAGLHPFSVLSEIGGYDPLIGRVNFLTYPDLYVLAFKISLVLLVILVVMIRRVYNKRLKRLIFVALPLFIALFIQFLFVNKIDAYIFVRHDFIRFIEMFFINLPAFLTGYMIIGIILFLLIMLTCYPIGILIDKLLLYITRRVKGTLAKQ